jgi:fibronectin type 3 domain-containing protein
MMNKRIVILLLLILLLASACGIKRPPAPWSSVVPRRIVDLQAFPREGRLLLEWTAPKANTDNSPLTDLSGFRILRSVGILVGGECKGCGEQVKLFSEIRLDKGEEAKGKRFSFFAEDLEARKVYVYQVVSTNRRDHSGVPSNPVSVYWDDPPTSPMMVKGVPGDKRVDLSWDPVDGVTGYNVYRKIEGVDYPVRPLNREPLTATQYEDLNVDNEKKYLYSIRALRRVVKTDVESKGSAEVLVTPTDLTAPGPPKGLAGVPLKNGIELNWIRNPESDLLGYTVYRRSSSEPEFKRLNEIPLPKEIYLDEGVALGQDYEYVVTAVDNSPNKNESPRSEEVRVKYIY